MARAESVELLSSLIDGLAPLGVMTPGRPLRAAEWNSLVDALRTMARLAVSRERTTDDFLDDRYARVDHDHVGQADLEWFEPATRKLLDEGLNGAVEQRASLKAARDEITQLRTSVDLLRQEIAAMRGDFDGLRDADSSRLRDIDRVTKRVESFANLEGRVANVSDRIGSMSNDLRDALAFRDELRDETGAPINVRAFGQRIGELEGLRNNLTTANGQVVRIREIESAIARLEGQTLTRGDLSDEVLNRLRDPQIVAQTGLVENVRGQVEDALADRFSGIDATTGLLTSEVTGIRATLAADAARLGLHDTRLADAEGRLQTVGTLSGRLDQQQTQVTAMDGRLQTVQTAVADLPALRSQVMRIDGDVAGIAAVRTSVTQIEGRVGAVEQLGATVSGLVTNVQGMTQRVGAIEQELPPLRQAATRVGQHTNALGQLTTRLQAAEAELDNAGDLVTRFDGIDTQLRGLATFQTATARRLDELGSRTAGFEGVAQRLSVVESASAEQRSTLARMGDSVRQVESTVGSFRETFDTRLSAVERSVFDPRDLTTRLTTLETSMRTVQPTVSTLSQNFRTMETRMGRLETRPIG